MIPEESEPQLQLRDYLRFLRRRRLVIVLTALLVTGAGFSYSALQHPVYQGVAEVLLQSRTMPDLFDSSGTQVTGNTSELVETESRILEGQLVRDAVSKKIGSAPSISTSQVGQTSVVQLKAESTVPARAADVANAYANAYIDLRRQRAVDESLAASQQIQGKVNDLQKQIDDLDNRVTAANAPDQAGVREQVAPQKDALVSQQSLFRQKLDQLQVDSAVQAGPELVTPATASSTPIKPTPVRTTAIAAVVGLLLGIGLAFVLEHLDDSIKTKGDLERTTIGIPVLGLIPLVPNWKDQSESRLVSSEAPRSAAAEAYRTLRTSLKFLTVDRTLRTLQITSPGPREGKTTTLANLGVALAHSGQRVVMIDCDLRRPRLHEFFGMENDIGFTSVLLGENPASAALQQVPDEERLWILPSGPQPPNPSELLSSPRTADVLGILEPMADIILVDSPPVIPVTDALVLSGHVDAILVVTLARRTSQSQTGRTIELLKQVDAPILGTLLNGLRAESVDSYGYTYYASKSPDDDGQVARKRRSRAGAV